MTAAPMIPTTPDLSRLIDVAVETGGETQRFDFKETLDLTKDEHKLRLVKAAAAFTNSPDGGFLLLGISDDRKIIGLAEEVAQAYDQTRVHSLLVQYLAPAPVIQVHHHDREGKRLVVIQIESFSDIPSVVRQSATFGKEKVAAGSFLFRTTGAQSAVLSQETDVRSLCDAIVARKASAFVELVQKGTTGLRQQATTPTFSDLKDLQDMVDQEWSPSPNSQRAYLEVAFSLSPSVSLSSPRTDELVRETHVPIRYGFPFLVVDGHQVESATQWGMYGRIPFQEWGTSNPPPTYLWAVSRKGTFVDREGYWEDKGSTIPGGVGIYHVVGRTILLVRFASAFSTSVGCSGATAVRLSLTAQGVQGRYLADEHRGGQSPMLRRIAETAAHAHIEISVKELQAQKLETSLALVEEVAWQFGRRDLSRHQISQYFVRARELLGPEYDLSRGPDTAG